MDLNDPYTLIGATGVILILFGIWRTSSGSWKHTTIWYELDTIIGASLIIVYQFHNHVYITLPINLLLVYVSFRGLSSYAERYAIRKKRKLSKKNRR